MKKLSKQIPNLSDSGYKNLRKSILATICKQLAGTFSFVCSMLLVYGLLQRQNSGNSDKHYIATIFVAGLLLMVAEILIIRHQYKTTNIPTYHESERLRLTIAEKLSKIPMSYYNSKNISEITGSLMDDCATVENLLSGIIPNVYASAITIPLSFIVLGIFDLRLGIAAFISVPTAFGIQLLSMKIQAKLVDMQLLIKHKTVSKMQEYIEGMQQIRANSQTGAKYDELTEALLNLKKASLKMELVSGIFTAGAEVVLQIGIGIVIFAATHYITTGTVSVFTMILFFSAVLKLYVPIASQITRLPNLMYMKKNICRISEILSQQPMQGNETPEIKDFEIEFQNVQFAYNHSPALKGISFCAEKNKVTAIVGPTGAGKTTIANLLARFWDADKGSITLGGIDITLIHPEYYSKYISFVFQNVVLFRDSIYNNILIGNPDASESEVLRAANLAQCDEFAQRLPDGYNTLLLENGKSLSGGERQRIAIARAMLKNAPIVLLDEATSSLDTMNEYYIHEALVALTAGKTVVIIAHTLRNIVNADNIIVINNGEIAEQGTHAQLMDDNRIYAKLYNIQKKAMEWDCRN